jgi:hypothetical protein
MAELREYIGRQASRSCVAWIQSMVSATRRIQSPRPIERKPAHAVYLFLTDDALDVTPG